MLMSQYQNAGQKHSLQIAYRSFEGVEKFKYFGINTNGSKLHARRD
jgi:hypothetical protein